MRLGRILHGLLFREEDAGERQKWREAVHEHRNVAAQSQAAARKSEKASDEAFRAAQGAIKLIEGSHKS